MAAPPPPPGELLTQIQDQIQMTASMFCDFIGNLQAQAPPLPVAGEPLVTPPAGAIPDIPEKAREMASRLVASLKTTQQLIEHIPQEQGLTEQQHYDRIRQLQQEHAQVGSRRAMCMRSESSQVQAIWLWG